MQFNIEEIKLVSITNIIIIFTKSKSFYLLKILFVPYF